MNSVFTLQLKAAANDNRLDEVKDIYDNVVNGADHTIRNCPETWVLNNHMKSAVENDKVDDLNETLALYMNIVGSKNDRRI